MIKLLINLLFPLHLKPTERDEIRIRLTKLRRRYERIEREAYQ